MRKPNQNKNLNSSNDYPVHQPRPVRSSIPADLFGWLWERGSDDCSMLAMPDWFPSLVVEANGDKGLEHYECRLDQFLGDPFETLRPNSSPWGGMVLTSEGDVSQQVMLFWGNSGSYRDPAYYICVQTYNRPGPWSSLALDGEFFADGAFA